MTLNFDDAAPDSCLNTRYQDQGVTFSRDDSFCVLSLDWSALGRSTTSPPMVLATISNLSTAPSYTSYLNISFARDTCQVSAFLGNDQLPGMTWVMTAYNASNQTVGSTVLATNGNTQVDELISLAGVGAFKRVRIEGSNPGLSVVLDDLQFQACPSVLEIPTLSPFGYGLLVAVLSVVGMRLIRRGALRVARRIAA